MGVIDLQTTLSGAAARFDLVGMQAALIRSGSLETVHWGLADAASGEALTDETAMPMGSVAKLVASALLLRQWRDQPDALHHPVRDFLPSFRVADEAASAAITPSHLLSHRAGFDGDWFAETGEDESAMARYVASLAALEQVTPPGSQHSYCNAGFGVVGHLSEIHNGRSWPETLREELADPMGLESLHGACPLAARERTVACGHDADGKSLERLFSPGHAPAGPGPVATMTDLARLAAGLKPFLTPDMFKAMTERTIEGPCATFASAWGLGTMHFDWTNGVSLWGHDGALPGIFTFLRRHEASDTTLAVCASGGDAAGFWQDVQSAVLAPLLNATPQPLPDPAPSFAIDPAAYEGTYALSSAAITVTAQSDALHLTYAARGPDSARVPTIEAELRPVDAERMIATFAGRSQPLLQRFVGFDANERASLFNFRGRVFPRISNQN